MRRDLLVSLLVVVHADADAGRAIPPMPDPDETQDEGEADSSPGSTSVHAEVNWSLDHPMAIIGISAYGPSTVPLNRLVGREFVPNDDMGEWTIHGVAGRILPRERVSWHSPARKLDEIERRRRSSLDDCGRNASDRPTTSTSSVRRNRLRNWTNAQISTEKRRRRARAPGATGRGSFAHGARIGRRHRGFAIQATPRPRLSRSPTTRSGRSRSPAACPASPRQDRTSRVEPGNPRHGRP